MNEIEATISDTNVVAKVKLPAIPSQGDYINVVIENEYRSYEVQYVIFEVAGSITLECERLR